MFNNQIIAGAAGQGGSFYSETIDNSVRLVGSSTAANGARFTQTFSTVDSSTDFTLNFWVKRNEKDNPINSSYAQNIFNFRSGTSATVLNDIVFAGNTYTAGDQILITDTNSASPILATTNLLRDFSAWYNIHIMADMNNATASERLKIFINGTEASYAVDNRSSYSTLAGLAAGAWTIGDYYATSYCIGSTIARWAFVDNSTLAASYFGEFSNGIWVPKALTGITWGSAGHLLDFAGTGTNQDSSGIGADTSGKDNHWAVNNIAASDVVNDSPTDNAVTMDPNNRKGATLSEGNLHFNVGTSQGVCATMPTATTGKWYFEFKVNGAIGPSNPIMWGFSSQEKQTFANYTTNPRDAETSTLSAYTDSSSWQIYAKENNVQTVINPPTAQRPAQNSILGLAYDADTGKAWMAINNVWIDSSGGTTGDPSTGANPTHTFTAGIAIFPAAFDVGGVHPQGILQADDSVLTYTPPTDFLTIKSSNMPEPTISPNAAEQADDYFNTVLYTGTGATQSITGVGFQPDWTWIKARSAARSNVLYDSVRGVTKQLISNSTNAESTASTSLTSFDSDGFSIGTSGAINTSSDTLVAWNWKAGGTAVSNSNGSITSSVSAAPDAGFSVVTYTGAGTGTVGHGLGITPSMYIVKCRSNAATSWRVYHSGIASDAETDYLTLDSDAAAADVNFWNDTAPTDSVFSVFNYDDTGTSSRTYVAYVFADVPGYSRAGSYVGNGNADGTFVFTGFRPAWVMTKRSDGTSWWGISDSARSPYNEIANTLAANENYSESVLTSDLNVDFLSNGFKIRDTDGYYNASGGNYIYLAFAEAPFKYANAR